MQVSSRTPTPEDMRQIVDLVVAAVNAGYGNSPGRVLLVVTKDLTRF